MKMIEGACRSAAAAAVGGRSETRESRRAPTWKRTCSFATANSARTSFSPSPTHLEGSTDSGQGQCEAGGGMQPCITGRSGATDLEVREDAEMQKKRARDSFARA